ncbi:MAG TPA: HDOD domain-containing protein [Tepidiformaceae bacterium]
MRTDPSDILRAIVELRPFPAVATRVMRMVNDDRTSAQELAQVLSADQAMTSKLLKLSNSAEAGYFRRVCSVREAVVVLGFKQVRQIAFVTSVISNFRLQRNTREWFDVEQFWLHNIEVAIAAETVARKQNTATPDAAFTTGVLHDIGRLVLAQALPAESREAHRLHTKCGVPLIEAELRTTGHTHDGIGGALAREWKFPAEIATAIDQHHSTEATRPTGLPSIITLCDRLARYHDESQDPLPDDLHEVDELCGGWPDVVSRSLAFIQSIEHGTRAA